MGAFEELVLLALARGRGEAYGTTVHREIEDKTGRDVTIGAVYATLDRLETKGLVRSHLGDATEGRWGRARRHFRLLPTDAEALSKARRMRAGLWEGVDLAVLSPLDPGDEGQSSRPREDVGCGLRAGRSPVELRGPTT